MPELVTALTIPPRASRLHRILEMQAIRVIVQVPAIAINTKTDLLNIVDSLVARRDVSADIRDRISNFTEREILEAVQDIRGTPLNQTEASLRMEELRALQSAATNGYPRNPNQGANYEFEVLRDQVRVVRGPRGSGLRVSPVSRLRVVMVQKGYRRLETDAAVVDRQVSIEDRNWYPGVELFGEGIFIDFVPVGDQDHAEMPELVGREADTWLAAHNNIRRYFPAIHLIDPYWTHPSFIWWHTLSHRLISALAIDCGYSSAALRERVYVAPGTRQGTTVGGLLIYTAQPGGDGTLGGLVALSSSFERVLARALFDVDSCSNDPLCSDVQFMEGRVNGPSCYACMFQSETSCEHRNMLLDRGLLMHNLP